MRIAVIDLGTNSVRFDVYEVKELGEVRRLHREKQMVRLGDGLFDRGVLSEPAIKRTVDAIDSFSKRIKQLGVSDVRAFATSAVRDSKNPQDLLKEVKSKAGIQIEVISGDQEALLIAKGILNNEVTPSGVFALIDIGGGSTEVSICQKKTILDRFSFKLGANRLHQMFLKSSPPQGNGKGEDLLAPLRTHIRSVIEPVVQKRNWPKLMIGIGSSGTARAIEKILKKKDSKVDPFRVDALGDLVKKLVPLTQKELLKIPGMDPKRVDIMLAGTVLLEEFGRAFHLKKFYTTEYSLRDGIFEEMMESLVIPPRR